MYSRGKCGQPTRLANEEVDGWRELYTCAGCSVTLYDVSKVAKNKKVGYKTMALVCHLCGMRGVSTFCTGCKHILCYDVNRSKQLDEQR